MTPNKRRIGIIVVVGLVCLLSIHWISDGFAPSKSRVVVSTGSKDGLYSKLGRHMAEIINRDHPDIHMEVILSAGSKENIDNLLNGKAHLALVQNDTVGESKIRSIAAIYPEVLHLLCRKESGIQSLDDLKGKSVSVGAVGSGTEKLATALLQFAGIDQRGYSRHQLSTGRAIEGIAEGRIDAVFFVAGINNKVCARAIQMNEAYLAPLFGTTDAGKTTAWIHADELAKVFCDGFRVHYPFISPCTIPMNAYPGSDNGTRHPVEPLPAISVSAVFVSHNDVSAETVKKITQAVFQSRAELARLDPAFSNLNESQSTANLQFPLHKGAEMYFRRDEPGFFIKYAEVMGFVLSAGIVFWGIISWGRGWMVQRKKDRIDIYYDAIQEIVFRLKEEPDLEELHLLNNQLVELQAQTSHELVEEKLMANESYLIYQNMLNFCHAMVSEKIRQRTSK